MATQLGWGRRGIRTEFRQRNLLEDRQENRKITTTFAHTCSLYSHRDSPALKIEAKRSSETSVLTKNTRRKIPEDGFLQQEDSSRTWKKKQQWRNLALVALELRFASKTLIP
jgi:actin-related protein